MSKNANKIIYNGDGGYHMSKSDVSEAWKAARKLKNVYDFSYFRKRNNKQKGTK